MRIKEKNMKLKMEVIYGDEICECLKEQFGCESDDELLVVFRAVMKQSLVKDDVDPEDLSIKFERID
jgi:hypothetical protein